MSELQSGRMAGTREVVTKQALQLGISLEGRPNRDPEIFKQIESLKKEIEKKNDALLRLNKDLRDLREQNDNLQITVDSKDKEIKTLKEKIKKLENEKKTLETNLRAVEVELIDVRSEVAEMKERNATLKKDVAKLSTKMNEVAKNLDESINENTALEERNATLEITVEKLSKKMDGMTKNLEESMSENTALKKEVGNLREEVESMALVGFPFPFLSDPVERASLVLGELCKRVQGMMYQKVFPNDYDYKKSYRVKHINEDIDELDDEQQKEEARKKWSELKKKLKCDRRHTRAMNSIQEGRNMTAHQDIDEDIVDTSVKLMDRAGKLTGWQSLACVNELIEMWKMLAQMQK